MRLSKKISRSTVSRMLDETASILGKTSTGFFRGTLGLPRRPGRSWTCMRGCEKANR